MTLSAMVTVKVVLLLLLPWPPPAISKNKRTQNTAQRTRYVNETKKTWTKNGKRFDETKIF
jgi:hypothetical protein